MTVRGKHGKPKTRLPTLPTALVNPATAARFTHSHRSATNPLSFTGYKAKPSPETLNLGWAETKCRSGPISVAKGNSRQFTATGLNVGAYSGPKDAAKQILGVSEFATAFKVLHSDSKLVTIEVIQP